MTLGVDVQAATSAAPLGRLEMNADRFGCPKPRPAENAARERLVPDKKVYRGSILSSEDAVRAYVHVHCAPGTISPENH